MRVVGIAGRPLVPKLARGEHFEVRKFRQRERADQRGDVDVLALVELAAGVALAVGDRGSDEAEAHRQGGFEGGSEVGRREESGVLEPVGRQLTETKAAFQFGNGEGGHEAETGFEELEAVAAPRFTNAHHHAVARDADQRTTGGGVRAFEEHPGRRVVPGAVEADLHAGNREGVGLWAGGGETRRVLTEGIGTRGEDRQVEAAIGLGDEQ